MKKLLYFCLDLLLKAVLRLQMRDKSCHCAYEQCDSHANINDGRYTAPPSPTRAADVPARRTSNAETALEDFVFAHYDCRYNVLDDRTELRPKDSDELYKPADRRRLNTLVMAARREGLNCWDRDVARLMCSDLVPDFHPFRDYMRGLPAWDGRDRVGELARRVSDEEVWSMGFRRWLLALAATWDGRGGRCGNAMAPLLVSREQGLGKSSFCRALVPPELTAHYTDRFDLSSTSQSERRLAYYGLINLDEFDRYGQRRAASLKNIMQMSAVTCRQPYSGRFVDLPRTASFIGTSNSFDLLTDPSGSRRFLCVEVKAMIDTADIDHDQIFAQLLTELDAGARTWFTKEEEALIQQNNRRFMRPDAALEVFHKRFRAALPGEDCRPRSATDIFLTLQRQYPAAMRGLTANAFARSLAAAGLERVHTRTGNVYRVVNA